MPSTGPSGSAGGALRALAVIPARGGSKRVPLKNIRELKGRPLIAYTIDAALESGVFEQVVVSTDSDHIAEIARACGAEVPFMRDSSIADDHTPVSAATADALVRLDPGATRFDFVAQLMANCPFRTAEDVVSSHDSIQKSGAESQISVCRYGWLNPWWAMTMAVDGALSPLFEEQMASRSQDLPEVFCPTGAVWWARAEVLREKQTFHVPGRTGWEIVWDHALDIDDEDDWRMAEVLANMARETRHRG